MSGLSPPQRYQHWCNRFLTLRLIEDGFVNIELESNFVKASLPIIENRLSGMLWHAEDSVVNVRKRKRVKIQLDALSPQPGLKVSQGMLHDYRES
eukprot:6422944-Amphidinium_carterae.2